ALFRRCAGVGSLLLSYESYVNGVSTIRPFCSIIFMWKSTVLISYSGMLVLGYSNTSCLTLFRILYSSSSSYENCILPLLTYNYKNACSFCQTAIYDFFIQNDCRYV